MASIGTCWVNLDDHVVEGDDDNRDLADVVELIETTHYLLLVIKV